MTALEFRVTLTVQARVSSCRIEQMLKDPLSHPEVTDAELNIQAIIEPGFFWSFFVPETVLKDLEERNVTVSFSSETIDDSCPQD